MLRPRVIPVLLLKNTGLVKSVKFKNHRYVGDPINAIKIFNDKEVDELIFLDIDASKNNTPPNFELISQIASECFMPVCYGGGITKLDQIEKMAQAVINTNAVISSKNSIASAITSLSKEVIIRAHTYFLKSYHDSFFAIHFHWMKHVDKLTKKNGYLSRHMAVHVYVMHKLLKEIENEWKTMTVFSPFIQYCNENIQNEDEKNMTINVMPAKFFKLAKDVLIKHFDQWQSPMLLPLVLGGDAITTQTLSSYFID